MSHRFDAYDPHATPCSGAGCPSCAPPSALAHIHGHLARQQAKRRPALSPSRTAACRRQSAYLLHRTPQSDLVDSDAADVGTIIHAGWADMLATAPHTAVEQELALIGVEGQWLGLWGTTDWLIADPATDTLTVGDLKTKSSKAWQRWVSLGGPDDDVWDQLHIYASAAIAWDGLPDLVDPFDPVWAPTRVTVQIVAIDRDTGQTAVWNRSADVERGRRLAQDLRELQDRLLAEPPDEAPRDGTGTGFPCGWCAWQTRCWGGTVTPLPDREAEQAARDYLRASAAEATARTAKATARERLVGRTVDGPDVSVRWSSSTRRTLDEAATLLLLAELDLEAPSRETKVDRLNVKWKRQPKEAE